MSQVCPSCRSANDDSADTCATCSAALSPLAPGAVIASRYEILSRLGKGGMGVVYKANDRLLNETVAIKILRQDANTPELTQRFRSEIKLARTVSHRNVCRIHEYGEDGGLRYISMAHVEGVDLKHVLTTRGRLPVAEAYAIAVQVADGLVAIHSEGIIHRDLKAANIMLDPKGVARLMDFGIAKQSSEDSAAGMTGTGQIIGSPDYMSPEQIEAKKLDFRSDVYAFGVVIYELFTGHVPFEADTPVAKLMKHLRERPLLEGPGAPPLPEALIPVLARALEKNREQRFASVEEMRAALVAARERRDDATATTHVPNLKATARVGAAQPPATPLPGPIETEAMPSTSPVTGPGSTRPAAPRKGRSSELPVRKPPGLQRNPYPKLAAGLAIVGIGLVAVLLFKAPPAAQPPLQTTTTLQPQGSTPPPTLAPAATEPAPIPTSSAESGRTRRPTSAVHEITTSRSGASVPAEGLTAARPSRVVDATPAPSPRAESEANDGASAKLAELLTSGEKALDAEDYDTAIRTYEQALALDPKSQVALLGRTTAVNARVTARAARGPAPAPGRRLIAGATTGQSLETQAAAAPLPPGFKETAGVEVTRDTQAADLPGQIAFELEPESPTASENYTIRILLANAGAASIDVQSVVLTTLVNGRKATGAVPPQVRSVGPKQKALLFSLTDMWRPDVKSWVMEVVVKTNRGETYRSDLVWK